MFIVKPCCERKPFEPHKKNCYFKRQQKAMDKAIQYLIRRFEQALKDQKGD